MIKEISVKMFKTSDGKRFEDEKFAELYETVQEQIQALEKEFPRVVDRDCEFVNGSGYVQRTALWVNQYKAMVFEINGIVSCSGLVTSENEWNEFSALERALGRCHCFDRFNREWGQPYQASHIKARVEKEWKP